MHVLQKDPFIQIASPSNYLNNHHQEPSLSQDSRSPLTNRTPVDPLFSKH